MRCVLKKEDDIFKSEYYNRSIDTYLVMHVVPVEWGSEHELEKVMLIAQDIGQKHELENLANTDGLTGLFNERYFNSILHKKELQKLPFILFYLDLDHFKDIILFFQDAAKIIWCKEMVHLFIFRISHHQILTGNIFNQIICAVY